MAAEYLANTDRENVLRACRALMEACEWLECIHEDVEAGVELNDDEFKASWKRCIDEGNAAMNALGYDKDLGN